MMYAAVAKPPLSGVIARSCSRSRREIAQRGHAVARAQQRREQQHEGAAERQKNVSCISGGIDGALGFSTIGIGCSVRNR